jgi:outer membrane protein OmpA-like peptidoglycan-associated protein
VTTVEIDIRGLSSPMQLGSEFLTYVLWAGTPDGHANNLGEILPDSRNRARLRTTTKFQSFSLFVTAEPYSAVRQPSEMLVLENSPRRDTRGRVFMVQDFKLMRREQYERLGNPLALTLDLRSTPLDMYQARNSVEIARSRGADRYAPEIFSRAEESLKMAEDALARRSRREQVISIARQTQQFSEDARALAVGRQEEARVENERLTAAAKAQAEAEARAAVEAADAQRRADEEARRQRELAAAREAQVRAEASAREAQQRADAAAREAQIKAQAEIAAAQARAQKDALAADAQRAQLASKELRAQLFDQFNRILETKDTPRGLVITMAGVLFDVGSSDLRPPVREQLARVAGIILAHPGLNLQVEGHTDNTGSAAFNQRLSEDRAQSVRFFLIEQGLNSGTITAKGFGFDKPVASNNTSEGRQKNRRVELIVSGQVIGVTIGRLEPPDFIRARKTESASLTWPHQ